MTQSPPAAAPLTGHATAGASHAHIDPLGLYLAVFAALLLMTVVTVAVSYVDFGAANTVIAVLIATMKALLVATFFMHLRHDRRFNALVFVFGLLFLSFLFLFTLTDFSTRGQLDGVNGTKVEDLTPAASASSILAPTPVPLSP